MVTKKNIQEDEWVNPEFAENEEDFFKEQKDENILTDEEIKELQPIAEEAKEEFQQDQQKKLKKTIATMQDLLNLKEKLFEIEIDVGDQILVFKARRLSDKERQTLLGINFGLAQKAQFSLYNGQALDEADYDTLREDGIKMLSEVIVEPKMTVQEWKDSVSTAILDKLTTKVQELQTEVDDVKLVNNYKKK